MISCGDCVKGIVYGNCGISPGNAACLYSRKNWWEEPPEKVIEYLERCKQYEGERYRDMIARIDTWIERVGNYRHE